MPQASASSTVRPFWETSYTAGHRFTCGGEGRQATLHSRGFIVREENGGPGIGVVEWWRIASPFFGFCQSEPPVPHHSNPLALRLLFPPRHLIENRVRRLGVDPPDVVFLGHNEQEADGGRVVKHVLDLG